MKEQRFALLVGRIALAAGFLSAVADRLGLWGPPGSSRAAWGDWNHFVANVATLNWFTPAPVISFFAWAATVAETLLSVLLLMGYKLRFSAYASVILLMLYDVAMTMEYGVKLPLDYSVLTAFAAAVLIGAHAKSQELAVEPNTTWISC
jgi:uncharacterized membrane protein YphA (DoxX/SURF4 family)